MSLSFLLPSIHKRHTGGNIYNRRIIAELSKRIAVDAHPWRPDTEPPPTLSLSSSATVVDSLFLRRPAPLRSLRHVHTKGTLVLMAHYLHCVDPTERDTEQADTERDVLPLFDGVITTSRYVKRALIDEGLPARAVTVVPPGLDAAYRTPLPAPPPTDPPTLLTVANVVAGKGLAAFARQLISLTDIDWQWRLIGDDTLDPEATNRLRTALQEPPIQDRVTGPIRVPPDEMRAQYDRAALFVLPSRFETCSMATREALARGCPVVGYDVGGMSENLGDATVASARPGHLVSPDAPTDLIDALRPLLTTPDTRLTMRAAAREQSRTFPTWAEAADRFYSALQSIASVGS